jgi:hypothetical protein
MRPFARSFALAVLPFLVGLVGCAADAPTGASAAVSDLNTHYSSWSPALSAELAAPGAHPSFNSAFLDGCPFPSRDGKLFFMASNRPRHAGETGPVDIDIWVSTRASEDEPWGEPVNVGAPVNSAANDFCPTLARDGHTFYFVSNRPGGCGGDDLYVTRFRDDGTVDEPENIGCQVNSAGNEAGPFELEEPGVGRVLYFSSTRAGGYSVEASGALTGDADVYRSEWRGGAYGPAVLVPGVNSAFDDGQPNVRRDALEIFFFSTRPGTLGMADIYAAAREKARDAWGTPVNLGPSVNSASAETRPSLSWDGTTLYFGSTRPGGEGASDLYVTTRSALTRAGR